MKFESHKHQSPRTELVLVRHASSTRAQEGLWGRLYDAPLAQGYQAQLRQTRRDLGGFDGQKVLSSPLLRCTQTAEHLFPQSQVELVPEFRAYHSGELESVTEEYVAREHPGYLQLSYGERFLCPRFNEESVELQILRVARGLHRVLQSNEQFLLIVTHYSTLNIIANLGARNWDTQLHAGGVYNVAFAGYLRIAIDPRIILGDIESNLGNMVQARVNEHWTGESYGVW